MSIAIALDNLTVAYDRHPAVHHVSGAFERGSMTAIVGPNGAGKSTLLKAIVGLLRPAEGAVRMPTVYPEEVAYLPQQADVDRSFPISVLDCVLLGCWRQVGAFGAIGDERVERARQALAAVGLRGFERRPLGTLSAGQFQRVLFARVMVQDAAVILLDEPFAAIDARTTHDLVQVVRRWNTERRTVIAVLHDLDQVRAHFPDTLLISRQCIGWGATGTILTGENLARARSLSEAWDEQAPVCEAGAPVAGAPAHRH
jgi:zinc/manganese transport system ATP-binding protein